MAVGERPSLTLGTNVHIHWLLALLPNQRYHVALDSLTLFSAV